MAIFTAIAVGVGLLIANGVKNELVDNKLEGDAQDQFDEDIAAFDDWLANRPASTPIEPGKAPLSASEDETGSPLFDDAMDQLA